MTRLHWKILLAVLLLGPGLAQAKQTLSSTRSLVFGRFVARTGGTVTVSPAGVRTSGGAVLLLSSTPGSAGFSWSDNSPANANKTCLIGLPADGTVTLTSGANTMAVNGFTSTPSGTSLMSGGTLQISVGATLSVGANQPPGNYSGSFSVTIVYQ